MSIQLAKILQKYHFFPFIISCDSRQIYQDLNIGTGKISESEMQGILHYGLNLISPTETFSVVNFEKYLDNCPFFKKWRDFQNGKIHNNPKIIPIICGGTGLYIDAVIFERNYLGGKPNPVRRQELENFRQKYGNEALWQKLYALDPEYAKELHINNHTYIIRAIEIFEETGKSKKESFSRVPTLKYPTFFLTPYTDSPENRVILYEKINARIKQMFTDGLVQEVEENIKKYGMSAP